MGDFTELIPIYGTYLIGKRFINNPSWKSAGELALSAAGDAAMLSGVGAGIGAALKAGNAAAKAGKIVKAANALKKVEAARSLKLQKPVGKTFHDVAQEQYANIVDNAIISGQRVPEKVYLQAMSNFRRASNADVAVGQLDKAKDLFELGAAANGLAKYLQYLFGKYKTGGQLISRNPVLRFKLGRKIVKAADGLKANEYGEQAYFLDRNGRAFKGHIDQSPENKRLTQRYILNGKQYGSFDGGKLYYDLSSLKPLNYKSNQYLLSKINYKPIETKDKDKRNTIITPVDNRFVRGFEGVKDEILKSGGVRAWQLKLKDFYAPNTYKEDGWWGENTQKAYEAYLLKNAPTLPTSEQLVLQVTQSTPVVEEVPLAGTDTILNLLTEMQKVMPATGTYVINSTLPKLNRSDTRWVINDALGKNAYNFTGALRKALRLYLNGEQYDANDLAAFGNLDIFNKYKFTQSYKKGGNMLPSRNIVERFKQRNFR